MKTLKMLNEIMLVVILIWVLNLKAQDFYEINTINTVELEFEQSNWDELLDQLALKGQEERLLGTAIVNGITYDSVGVRYKGNSSYNANNTKNPLNIKLDYVIDDQEHQGFGTLKLSNAYKDPSFIREALSYEIAREYLPASGANFCKVYINGTYIGLYTSVQDVDKHFMRTHYYSGNNPFFKGELTGGGAQSVVKVWGYLGEDSSAYKNYFEIESDEGWADLIDFLDILNNNPDSVEDVLNVDRHLWMLAFDILMVNLDAPINFGHNYYLYKDDTGRFNPVIWDLNENFGIFSRLLDGAGLNVTGMQQMNLFLNSTNANYPIISKILSNPTYKKIYVAHMKTIIDEYFSTGQYRTRALEIQDIIDSEIQNDPNFGYSYSQFKENIDNSISGGVGPRREVMVGIAELMDARVTYLESQSEFHATQPVISNVAQSPANVAPYESVLITAEVQTADNVQLAYRSSPVEAFNKVEMFDDGNHNDGSAGDGVYGASVSVGSSGIQYYIYAENQDAAAFSPRRAEYEFYTIETSGELVINEFMASNKATAADQDGEFDDWVELYNNSDSAIDLTGYFLSDDADDLTKWTFPETTIDAGGYLIIWIDSDEEQEGLHANFKLSASGEAIYLSNPAGVVINDIIYSTQQTDVSTGRTPNGTGSFDKMTPTFAKSNDGSVLSIDEKNTTLPKQVQLEQNYPNPFNPITTIRFSLNESGNVSLQIFNVLGEQVATLVNGQLEAGTHNFQWQAGDFACGVYFYRLSTGSFSVTKRMILMK